MLVLVLLRFVLLCKIHVFCIGKGKMAADEVFQSTSSAKLRLLKGYRLCFIFLYNSQELRVKFSVVKYFYGFI